EVATQLMKVDGNLAIHVGAIDNGDDPLRTRRVANLPNGHDEPGGGGDSAKAHHACARSEAGGHEVRELSRVFWRDRHFDLANCIVMPRLPLQPSRDAAGMLLSGREHFGDG